MRQIAIPLFLGLAVASAVRAEAPRTIAFQGVLATPSGSPKPNGPYSVTFRLFDDASAGNLLWTEETKTVTVAGGRGVFSTSLGSPTPFGALAFDAPYYLEIQMAGEPAPMAPRIALQSAAYALNVPSASLTLPFSGSASVSHPGSALDVRNTGDGFGILGTTDSAVFEAAGVQGVATSTGQVTGVYGRALEGTLGTGVAGKGSAVGGYFQSFGPSTTGLFGIGVGIGVQGNGETGAGVAGYSNADAGVYGRSSADGKASVFGYTNRAGGSLGVWGANDGVGAGVQGNGNAGAGVAGYSVGDVGVYGRSEANGRAGVFGYTTRDGGSLGVWGANDGDGAGVQGNSAQSDGVIGFSSSANNAGVAGINLSNGFGVYGASSGGGYAGFFNGRVRVNVLEIAGGADVAEQFDVNSEAEPGTVLAIDPDSPGKLRVADAAYDRGAAGVVSGANGLAAGMVLSGGNGNRPVAMSGRVWVKCDASFGPIKPTDLLTTSETPGHAMKASDAVRAQGAVIGKAMTALGEGKGLVLALVSLQ